MEALRIDTLSRWKPSSDQHKALQVEAFRWLCSHWQGNEAMVECTIPISPSIHLTDKQTGKRKHCFTLDVANTQDKVCIECGRVNKDKLKALLDMGWYVFFMGYGSTIKKVTKHNLKYLKTYPTCQEGSRGDCITL